MTPIDKNKQPSLKIPKAIAITAKFLEKTAPRLMVKFIAKIFVTPIQYPTPARENEMLENSLQELCYIPSIQKKINIYKYKNPNSDKKVLLVHGWSGRGTQLYSIAKELAKKDYQILSFDGPSHGKSDGKQSHMKEFISSIEEINKQYGPFEYIIGHSLGAMATANAVANGVKTKKAVLIAGGDVVTDVIDEFIKLMDLDLKYSKKLQRKFEKDFELKMNDYSVSKVGKDIEIPCLIIHDTEDTDVPYSCAENIQKNIKNSTLVTTTGLGHRKILGDKKVIQSIIDFIDA